MSKNKVLIELENHEAEALVEILERYYQEGLEGNPYLKTFLARSLMRVIKKEIESK